MPGWVHLKKNCIVPKHSMSLIHAKCCNSLGLTKSRCFLAGKLFVICKRNGWGLQELWHFYYIDCLLVTGLSSTCSNKVCYRSDTENKKDTYQNFIVDAMSQGKNIVNFCEKVSHFGWISLTELRNYTILRKLSSLYEKYGSQFIFLTFHPYDIVIGESGNHYWNFTSPR